jgi:large subunit ribosomal protein L10
MALTKEKKQSVQAKVADALACSQSVVFVQSKGLSVGDTQEMRASMKKEGVSYYVAKKTLVQRALDAASYTGERPVFAGELAIAYGDDLVAPAREVQQFVKSTKEKVVILGGVFDGTYMDAAAMTEIASIPSRHTLYAQFVNIINSPLQKMVVALDKIAEKRETATA